MEFLYAETGDFGNKYREEQLEQIKKLIAGKRKLADLKRVEYMQCDFSSVDAYKKSIEKYRTDFINMLGWPLTEFSEDLPVPGAKVEFVSEDSIGKIYRLNIDAMQGVTTYGILFLPHTEPPYPLVIAQHGGCGTPELCSGFFGSGNYNDMTRRILKKGVAVFVPQMLLWGEEFGPANDRLQIDCQLKQLGGSITALELFKLKRSIDYLHSREDINASQTGMIGLSYGGFYTLFATAVDVRIKAALSSCFFNNRFIYDWHDWTWFNSGNTFLDSEICSLICPRPLYIEVADRDELFDVTYACEEYKKVQVAYEKLDLLDKLCFKVFKGVHELDLDDSGIDFLYKNILNGS